MRSPPNSAQATSSPLSQSRMKKPTDIAEAFSDTIQGTSYHLNFPAARDLRLLFMSPGTRFTCCWSGGEGAVMHIRFRPPFLEEVALSSRVNAERLPLNELLAQTLANVAFEAGFCDQTHLTRHFRCAFEKTPGQWLRQQQTPTIEQSLPIRIHHCCK